jgi:predicted nucleic acid-binding protein
LDGDSPGYEYPHFLISSLLKDGLTRKTVLLSPFEMYTLELAKYEMDMHKEELLKKSKLDEKSFDLLREVIFSRVNLVHLEEIEDFKVIAEDIMCDIDIDDSPFLAIAISLNYPIWSNDGHFKRQNIVRAFSTLRGTQLLSLTQKKRHRHGPTYRN